MVTKTLGRPQERAKVELRQFSQEVLSEIKDRTQTLLSNSNMIDREKTHMFLFDILPDEVSLRVKDALFNSGMSLSDILAASDVKLLSLRSFGVKSLAEIKGTFDYLRIELRLHEEKSELSRSQESVVAQRLDVAKSLLRKREIADPNGTVLAELLRQLSEKPKADK